MSILIEKPGILTTIQDLGRFGYQKLGINPGGAMDPVAARLVNILLGNDENDAVLEMHFPAPRLAFESDVICSLGGADFAATLDGVGIDNWRPFFAPLGSVLEFDEKRFGNRAYFAVMGGFDIDPWLGSASTNLAAKFGGLAGRTLRQHDKIRLRSAVELTRLAGASISTRLIPAYSKFPTIRIIAGAEFGLLSQHGRDMLLNRDFSITNDSNRMGFRVTGEPIALSAPLEMVSSAVSVGTIQLLADGQLIILMADHQTTGGYPRIAHVIAHDLPLVAQLGSNDKIKFEQVDIGEAEELSMQFERDLSFFRVACRFQGNSGKDQSREDRP